MKNQRNQRQNKKGRSEGRARESLERDFNRDVSEIRNGSRKVVSKVCQDYLKALVDTRNAPKVGVPTLQGGMPGRTGVVRYTQQLEVFTGTTGAGFLHVKAAAHSVSASNNAGPYNNTNSLTFTGPTFAGTTIPTHSISTPTGVFQSGWTQSPHRLVVSGPQNDLQWRPVGITITLFPDSSLLAQNGRIVLLEAPGHDLLNENLSDLLLGLESYPEARVIRGTKTGSQEEKYVLNWHPKSGSVHGGALGAEASFSDFNFNDHRGVVPSSSSTPQFDGLMVAFFADAGLQFHCEVTCMYEVKGKIITSVKPRVVDSRGMDLISNIIAAKMLSGYVGKPEHVYESYLAKAWSSAEKTAGFVSKHSQELMNGAGKALDLIGGFVG